MKFQDQVVWITGASSGIGEALAYEFSRAGAKLILSARRENELARVQAQCASGNPSDIFLLPLDLSQLDTLAAKAKQALAAFGRVDTLVNNGGIGQRGRVVETSLEVDRILMSVNYLSYVALTKGVLPAMLERKSGHIVVISSLMGELITPKRSAYAASKHALHGFFDCLRAEVAKDNVKISVICPGFVKTNISYNALRPDATPFAKMDREHANAMSAEECAKQILNAIAKSKGRAYISGPEKYAVLFRHLFPGVYDWAVGRYQIT